MAPVTEIGIAAVAFIFVTAVGAIVILTVVFVVRKSRGTMKVKTPQNSPGWLY